MEVLHAACIVIHFCAIVLAAPPLTPHSLSLPGGLSANLTTPFRQTQSNSLNRLPPDPFLYPVPTSDETVRFYSYGPALPRRDVIHAIVTATRAIVAHGSSSAPIPDRMLRYGAGDVFLLLHHSGRMTWKVWETALQSIVEFLERYEYVDMEFDVGKTGFEHFFGTGALGMMQRGSSDGND